VKTTHEFSIPLPPESAWPILLDLEQVAPCLPGASITGVDGEDYEGRAKIKVGPITVEYKGVARFVERDDATHRAVIQATGRDAKGQGGVTANIVAQVTPEGSGSKVLVETDMDLSGKVAQFGRGVIEDTSTVIFRRFAQTLAEQMSAATPAALAAAPVGGRPPPAGGAPPPRRARPVPSDPSASLPRRAPTRRWTCWRWPGRRDGSVVERRCATGFR
jgi:carbon monoxide dehydrogenase subunit G